MKKILKSLLTLGAFSFSLFGSGVSTAALEEITYAPTDSLQYEETVIMSDDTVIYSQFLPELNSYAFNENSFSFSGQLDKNNKAAYDAMKVWLEPTAEQIIIYLPEAISYQTKSADMNGWDSTQTEEFWNLIFSNILYGEQALMFDYPELFWVDTAKIKVSLGNIKKSRNFLTGMYTMKVSEIMLDVTVKDSYTDVETALEYKKQLEASVKNFEIKGSDRWQQLKYIHDHIAQSVSYNLQAPYRDSAVGLFFEPYQIVCEGYSKAFKLLCDKADIPCIVVPGNIDTQTRTGHMWNYVMMEDGKWYGVDCTWDDTDSETSPVKYTYFLKGSESFGTNHFEDSNFSYPTLNTEDYVYSASKPSTTASEPTSPSTSTTVKPEHIEGDYNMDGKIDSADIVILKKFIVNKLSANDKISSDDLNNDNVINIYDCMILIRKILKGV